MATIDAAIIKALVEHIGGDSSGIPDGTIGGGGKTYAAGDGINIENDTISVRYDTGSMNMSDGVLSAKPYTATNGIQLDGHTFQLANSVNTLNITNATAGKLTITDVMTANLDNGITAKKAAVFEQGATILPGSSLTVNGNLSVPQGANIDIHGGATVKLGDYIPDLAMYLQQLEQRIMTLEQH